MQKCFEQLFAIELSSKGFSGMVISGGGVVPRTNTISGRPWRALIGGFAAYVIALQLTLSGFIAVSQISSAAAQTAICTEHAFLTLDDVSGQPSDHRTICPCGPACAMFGCMVAIGAKPSRPSLSLGVAVSNALPWVSLRIAAPWNAAAGPHSARAPPTS
jgi:hypothetical protein